MLKYLIIILDDSSVPFCHYQPFKEKKLISEEDLQQAVKFAMIHNLNVQFVWPDYELPEVYKRIISSIDHTNIVPIALSTNADINADIIVVDQTGFSLGSEGVIVARIDLHKLIDSPETLLPLLQKAERVNIVITDPENFKEIYTEAYRKALKYISDEVFNQLKDGHNLQVNLITDRMVLTGMNNCNAGMETLTVAPDGNFHICPAFYFGGSKSLGSVENEPNITNPQLYRIDHSPICRECDAWHCRRCVWLNKNATLEVNTPGHEQCVMAHLEREAARQLNERIRQATGNAQGEEIPKLDYLDPFDIVNQWK